MSPGQLPQPTQTIVGYLLWWMERGASLEEASERARLDYRFSGNSERAFSQAANYAQEATDIQGQVAALQGEAQFRPGAVPSAFSGGTLGLRVIYAYTDIHGNQLESSVVINVGPQTTMEQLRAQVDEIAYQGLARGTNFSPLPAVALTQPEIYQVMPGGYTSALLTLP